MRTFSLLTVFVVTSLLSGCMQSHFGDDLRAVPVTNNPNILPRSGDATPTFAR